MCKLQKTEAFKGFNSPLHMKISKVFLVKALITLATRPKYMHHRDVEFLPGNYCQCGFLLPSVHDCKWQLPLERCSCLQEWEVAKRSLYDVIKLSLGGFDDFRSVSAVFIWWVSSEPFSKTRHSRGFLVLPHSSWGKQKEGWMKVKLAKHCTFWPNS